MQQLTSGPADPAAEGGAAPDGGADRASRALRGARLLLVDDNPIDQELASEFLTSAGAVVAIANHGREAIDMLELQDYDAVLMDCQMPVLDGYEAARLLRRDRRHAQLQIIALSPVDSVSDLRRVAETGMDDVIAKPLDLHEVRDTVAKALRRRSLARNGPGAVPSSSPVSGPVPIAAVPDAPQLHGLPELPGIDVEAGLRVMGGDEPFYRQMLLTFASTQGDFALEFEAALAAGDMGAAARSPHSLKGVAGSLGANELQKLAGRLEAACKAAPLEPARIQALQAELQAELARVVEGIRARIPPE